MKLRYFIIACCLAGLGQASFAGCPTNTTEVTLPTTIKCTVQYSGMCDVTCTGVDGKTIPGFNTNSEDFAVNCQTPKDQLAYLPKDEILTFSRAFATSGSPLGVDYTQGANNYGKGYITLVWIGGATLQGTRVCLPNSTLPLTLASSKPKAAIIKNYHLAKAKPTSTSQSKE